MSSAFALLSDICIAILGGTLKRREKISGRLADVLSNISAVKDWELANRLKGEEFSSVLRGASLTKHSVMQQAHQYQL